jgi:hypothetical protein
MSGSAVIFRQNDPNTSGWVEQDILTASDGAAFDRFGCSVSISGDYAVVGARFDDDNGSDSGSAYIFHRNDAGWTEYQKVITSDGEEQDHFGFSAALDGNYAIVGATGDDDEGDDSGSAYVLSICPSADLNGDCAVDLKDLIAFSLNWLAEQP